MPASPISTERVVYTITFRPKPGIDGPRAVRELLKLALRVFGLRCVKITECRPE
jgi:hypothetical protein